MYILFSNYHNKYRYFNFLILKFKISMKLDVYYYFFIYPRRL